MNVVILMNVVAQVEQFRFLVISFMISMFFFMAVLISNYYCEFSLFGCVFIYVNQLKVIFHVLLMCMYGMVSN
jgi:hypothetical protein